MNPLSESTYLVLLSLYHTTLHGYGITKKIEEVSEGTYTIAPGTLYGILKNIEKQGLIEAVQAEQDPRKKKSYQITEKGKEVFDVEFERYQKIIQITNKVCDEGDKDVE